MIDVALERHAEARRVVSPAAPRFTRLDLPEARCGLAGDKKANIRGLYDISGNV